ncbi:hypothetical protein NBRC116493_20830 [Aurantivibrio infirmus]
MPQIKKPTHIANDARYFNRNLVLIFFLWLAVMVSALSVVYSTHKSRQLLNELENFRKETNELYVNRSRYLLEQSTLADYSRVEAVASAELNMSAPEFTQIIVLEN